jgi:hypothetical protein
MATKSDKNGRSLLYQMITMLGAVGILGGGGYVGIDSVKSEVVIVKTEAAHTNANIYRVEQKVQTLSDELKSEFREHMNLRSELLEVISRLTNRITRLETKILNGEH